MTIRVLLTITIFLLIRNVYSQPTKENLQMDMEPGKTIVSVLGLFHFDNPGIDDYKPTYPFDILEEERQNELASLLEVLKTFRPTKIVVEVNRKKNEALNKDYFNYLNGTFSIKHRKSEIYQIAFRLAKALGHKRIYASDNPVGWFGSKIDWENYDAKVHREKLGQQNKYQSNYKEFERLARFEDSLKTAQRLKEFLVHANRPECSQKSHHVYLASTVITGAGDNYLGADAVARWYRRNIHIYSNIYDISELGDRILVLYGLGHLHILRQLFMDSPVFEYQEITNYIN